MAPLKGKTNAVQTKVVLGGGPSISVGLSKFKIYSENGKFIGRSQDNGGATSSRTSLLSNKGTLLANNTSLKDHGNGAGETSGSHDALVKMKVGRKALADVSNVRGNSSRFEKPSGSRNSVISYTLNSTASSSRPLVVKVKPNLILGVTTSHTSVKANAKAMRTSLNFHGVQARETVENKPRQLSSTNHTITRKSFLVSKSTSQLNANKLQGNVTSRETNTTKLGFPLKTRVGGKVVSQVSNLKGKSLKDRISNVLTAPRNQTNKDVPQKLRKSIKPVVRTTSQRSNARTNSTSNNLSTLDKSLVEISARGEKVSESSIPKTFKSLDSHEEVSDEVFPAEDSVNFKPAISKTTADKRSKRRKSYTSLLISKSKLLGKNNDVMEQKNLPNIDDQDNPLEVAEYVDDIYQYYWIMEAQNASLENYMMIQTEVTSQMRGILINWLIEVHLKFDLMPETLYLTVTLLDRYLSLVVINKKEMQLVGLTSLLLASKYEDFWHPRVKDLISTSAESYTRKEMLDMEKDILKKLKFRLNLPTAYVFMLRFLKASQSDEQLEHLAFYLIELCLVDYETLKFRPSLLCASAVYVARCTLNKAPAWTPLLSKHARYEGSRIRDCAEMIHRLHKAARTGLLKVTYDKYKTTEFGGVSAIKPLEALLL